MQRPLDEDRQWFNQPLVLNESLTRIWRNAAAIHPGLKGGMRYWQPDNLLLRSHTVGDIDSRIGVDATLEIAAKHFLRLRGYGMLIVSHLQESRADLRPARQRPEDTAVAYSAAKFVTVVDEAGLPNLEFYSNRERLATKVMPQLVVPLRRYIGWCVATRSSYMLADIYSPNQYSYYEPTNSIFLHDIDPLIVECDRDGIDQQSHDIDTLQELLT